MRLFVILICSIAAVMILTSCSFSQDSVRVCFQNSTCINAEVVDEPKEMQKGLMGRTMLPDDRGMLFVFPDSDMHGIWMKNMAIPIDILWLDEDKAIIHIVQDARPCIEDPCTAYYPQEPARYVIEVQSGFADRKDVEIGQKVSMG